MFQMTGYEKLAKRNPDGLLTKKITVARKMNSFEVLDAHFDQAVELIAECQARPFAPRASARLIQFWSDVKRSLIDVSSVCTYLETVLYKREGRGLPTKVDLTVAFRVRNSAQQAVGGGVPIPATNSSSSQIVASGPMVSVSGMTAGVR